MASGYYVNYDETQTPTAETEKKEKLHIHAHRAKWNGICNGGDKYPD
jgi:hypothetical protein